MRLAKLRMTLQFCTLLTVVACATQGENDRNKELSSYKESAGTSRPGNWVDGLLMGIALISNGPNLNEKKRSYIVGVCQVRILSSDKKPTSKPCLKTYVTFREEKSASATQSIVWVDDDGRFQFPIHENQRFVLEAINDEYGIRSNSLTVAQASQVILMIELHSKSRDTK
jgi:hypothetical protein